MKWTISGHLAIAAFATTVVSASSAVVINEVHYNPPDNTVRQEFIELYNPDTVAAELGGWRLSGAIDFTFPTPTTIPAGGYLLVAEDPATMLSTFGVSALGPYTGKLNSEGETIRLRDQNDSVVDEVDYQVGFPWPVASNGDGASIELIHPALDNSLGSSWRSSQTGFMGAPANYVLAGSDWSYRKGTSEASSPTDAWRETGFVEDASWLAGTTVIGFGDGDDDTLLTDMQGGYSSVFMRKQFEVSGPLPSQLLVRVYYDDGAIVWINGVEVARLDVESGDITFEGIRASDPPGGSPGAAVGSHEGAWEDVTVPGAAGILVPGTDTVAVHAFNTTQGSGDFSIDCEVKTPPPGPPVISDPTPGAPNAVFSTIAAPNIRKVDHAPEQPTAADPVVITAKVTDPEGVASVLLEYQVVAPGDYVPARLPHPVPNIPTSTDRTGNPAYENGWVPLAMVDDGTGDDALAGDDTFTATLPAQAHRTLVRYRITVEDTLGVSARVPYSDDLRLNFAYFVYDGVPAYEGNSATVMADTLPVYHLITRDEDYAECIAYNSSDRIPQGGEARFYYNWDGTIVYDGEVYDNIRYRLRGANGRYQSGGKRSMRFRFNDGSYLQARDHFGEKYDQKWRTLTLGKCSSNRGTLTFGLNEVINFYLFNKLGVPAANAQWLHWRVIDGADEDPDPLHGDFHGFYLVTETYDVRFLDEHGLEKGNLYKLINQTNNAAKQQRYQAAFAPGDGSDHNWIEGQLDGSDSATVIRDNVSLEKWTRSHALVQAIRHYDYWPSANKNMVYYFEPDYTAGNSNRGKLWILPWDTDATWGPTYNNGHDVVYNALFASSGGGSDSNSTPELWPEYYNEVREIRDLLWQPDQIEPLIDEFAGFIDPLEAADASRWKGTPADAGNYNGLHGPGKTSLAAYVQDMKNFAFVGGSWDGGNVGAGGRANDLDSIQGQNGEGAKIPDTPTISYTGDEGFPTDGLSFQCSDFGDPQGDGSFGAMQWRVAEITDPTAPAYDPTERFKLEIEATWESGELATFSNTLDLPVGALRPGHTYRARVRHLDDTGRASHWSVALEFTTTEPDVTSYLDGLVISEIMYHPAADADLEFIELMNIGATTLDLTPLRFTKGVDFDFAGSAITTIAPGERVLVVKNQTAFEAAYGNGFSIVGEYQFSSSNSLNNGGERLKLSFGAGTGIRDFDYDDAVPWPTSPGGDGPSLVLIDPMAAPDHSLAANWRPSTAVGGNPGASDASPPFSGDPDLDGDSDGLSAFLEYAMGSSDGLAGDGDGLFSVGTSEFDDGTGTLAPFLTISYQRKLSADDVVFEVQVSADLTNWSQLGTVYVSATYNSDGTDTVTFRSANPLVSISKEFLRLRVRPR